MTTHLQAKAIADALPGIDAATSLLVRAIALIEGHYGDAHPGTHSWGNIIATPGWTGRTFTLNHTQWIDDEGKKVKRPVAFRAYDSDEKAAEDLWRVLQRSHSGAVAAVRRGDWWDVPRELRESRYYLGTKPPAEAIREYTKLLRGALASITSSTKEANPLQSRSGSVVAWAATLVVGTVATKALMRLIKGR